MLTVIVRLIYLLAWNIKFVRVSVDAEVMNIGVQHRRHLKLLDLSATTLEAKQIYW